MSKGARRAIPRRRLLVGLAACAAPLGCSGGRVESRKSGSLPCAAPSDGGAGQAYCLVDERRIRVAAAAALEVGQAMLTNIDDKTAVIVARDAQGFHALSAICTHACCLVSLCRRAGCGQVTSNPGECGTSEVVTIDETTAGIACPCHGSSFRLIDGTPATGPARRALPSYALTFDAQDAIVDTGRAVDPMARA